MVLTKIARRKWSALEGGLAMSIRKLGRKLWIGAAAALAAFGAAPASAQSAADDAYARSDYGYCDAKKVASVWHQSINDAKTTIGNKILTHLENLLDQDIASTSRRVRCDWEDIGLRFQDAQKLGKIWGLSPGDAKTKAERLATQMGGRKFLRLMGLKVT
jgi:hypothetical protein